MQKGVIEQQTNGQWRKILQQKFHCVFHGEMGSSLGYADIDYDIDTLRSMSV